MMSQLHLTAGNSFRFSEMKTYTLALMSVCLVVMVAAIIADALLVSFPFGIAALGLAIIAKDLSNDTDK